MNMPKTTASTLASEEGDDQHDLPDSKRLRPTESTSSSGSNSNSNSNSNSREESSIKKSRDHASVNYLSSQEPIATSGDQVQQFANLARQNTALRGTSTTFQPLAPNLEIILKEADPEQPIQDPSSGSPSSGLQINPPRGNLRRRDVGSPSNALRSLLVDRRRTRTSPPSDDSASPPTVAAASFAHQHQTILSTTATTKPPQTIRWYHTALLIGHSTYIDGLILEQQKQQRDQQQSNYSIAFPDVDEELWDLAMSFSFQAQRQFLSQSSSSSTKDETKESTSLENQPFANTRDAVDDSGYTAASTRLAGRAPMAFPELVRPASASPSSLVSMIMSGTKGDTQHCHAPKEEEEDPEVMNVHQALRLAPFYDKYGFVRAKQICDKVIASYLAKFQEICQRQQAYEWEQHDHFNKQLSLSPLSTPSPQQDQMTLPSTTSPIRRMLTRDHPTARATDHIGESQPSSASPTIIFNTDTISSLVYCSRVANLPIAQEQARSLLKQVFFHWQDFHQGHVGPAMFSKGQIRKIHPFLIEFVEEEPSVLDTLHPGVGSSYTMEEFKSPFFPRIYVTEWRLRLAQDTLLRHDERMQILQRRVSNSEATGNASTLTAPRSFTQLLMTGIAVESPLRDENYQSRPDTESSGGESSVSSTDEFWFDRDTAYNIWQSQRKINLRSSKRGGMYQKYTLTISCLEDEEDWRIEAESQNGSEAKLLWQSFGSSNLSFPPKSLWKRCHPGQTPEIQGQPKIEYAFLS